MHLFEPHPLSSGEIVLLKSASTLIRFLSVLAIPVILLTIYLFLIRPAQLRWGATQEEIGRSMPGDELVADPTFVATRAITIRGGPEKIWPWIVQMGYDRAGYYGYDLIENIGSKTGIRSSESIVPELQHPKTGDVLPISKVAHLTFGQIEPNQFLIWQSEAVPHDGAFTWALYPIDESRTRLVSRIRLRYHRESRALALDLFTEFADHVAVPKILAGVRDRVEGRVPESLAQEATEIAIWILAFAEFAIAIVFVFRWRQWWRAWFVALGAAGLLMLVLYAHAPMWFAAFACGIALVIFRLSSKLSSMRSKPPIPAVTSVAIGAYLLAVPIVILWLSGSWRWVEGWIFGVWFSSFFGTCLWWLYDKDPALLAERFRRPGSGGQSRSDLAILIGVKVGATAWFVLPPLDMRLGWLPRLPLWSEICGPVLLVGGSFFLFRSFTDNPFLSQLVRIQSERGQHVIDTGVYGIVRHPMYLGADMMFIGGALLLGSVFGLLVGLGLVLLLAFRIFGEEKLLTRDLEGYQAYRLKVGYRLVPRVW